MRPSAAALLVALLPGLAVAAPIRAAYFYNYMGADHLDSLAARGFDRAVIHWITDSLDASGQAQLRAFVARGSRVAIEVTPQWALQARSRLTALSSPRRYTWGAGRVEPAIACPMDSLFWRGALLDRAEEVLAVVPALRRLAVDLELYQGGRHHYDAGPCRCGSCVREYTTSRPELAARAPHRLSGLMLDQEGRLARLLERLLREFAARHPGVEIGIFDLDFDSFVHRALARALARAGVPTVNYCERSYGVGGSTLVAARERLRRLGHAAPVMIGGLWLKRFEPDEVPLAVGSILERAEGYFAFTTFSLWRDPALLTGPYTLLGAQSDYWSALERANRSAAEAR